MALDPISYTKANKALKEAKANKYKIGDTELDKTQTPLHMQILSYDEDLEKAVWIDGDSIAVVPRNVNNLTMEVLPSAQFAKITWDNPESIDITKIFLFVSYTQDLIATDFTYCNEHAILLSDDFDITSQSKNEFMLPITNETRELTGSFRIFVSYDLGEIAYSSGQTINQKLVDTDPTDPVTNITVQQIKDSIRLTWENPSGEGNEDFAYVVLRSKIGSYPNSRHDGTAVYTGSETSVVIPNITKGQHYFFRIFCYDSSLNVNSDTSQQIEILTDGQHPNEVQDLAKTEIHGAVGLKWSETNCMSDWKGTVVVRKLGAVPPSNINDGTLVMTNFTRDAYKNDWFYDSGLENNVTYTYKFYTYDEHDNYSEGVSITATPVQSTMPEVLNLKASMNDTEGKEIKLSFQNPFASSYKGRAIYYAEFDLEGMSFEECEENADVHLLDNSVGAGNGAVDSYIHTNRVLETTYYYRIFTRHDFGGVEFYSNGRSAYKMAIPTDYNDTIEFLEVFTNSSSISIRWDDPIDVDGIHKESMVRYKVGSMPVDATDGMLVGVYERNQYKDTLLTIGSLASDMQIFVRVFPIDKYGNISENPTNVTNAFTYSTYGFDMETGERLMDAAGKNQSFFDTVAPWKDMSRCVINDAGQVQYYLDDENSSLREDGTVALLDGSQGQVCVRIPRFWFKFDSNKKIYVVNGQVDGYTEFPETFVGAFEGYLNGTKLESRTGVHPTTDYTLSQFRGFANNRGTGWGVMDIQTLVALRILFLVEYAQLNSQLAIGNGIVNDTEIKPSGATVGNGNNSGVGSNGAITYRGLENIYGNTFEFVDGMIATSENYLVANGNYSSIGSYVPITNVTPSTDSGFISKFGNSNYFVGEELTGTDSNFVGDFQYGIIPDNERNELIIGGDFSHGSKSGLFANNFVGGMVAKTSDAVLIEELEEGNIFEFELDLTDMEIMKIASVTIE